jgi:hypothetical protein
MSKGSKRRPLKVGTKEFAKRWDEIYQKDELTDDEEIERMKMEAQTFRDSDDLLDD